MELTEVHIPKVSASHFLASSVVSNITSVLAEFRSIYSASISDILKQNLGYCSVMEQETGMFTT